MPGPLVMLHFPDTTLIFTHTSKISYVGTVWDQKFYILFFIELSYNTIAIYIYIYPQEQHNYFGQILYYLHADLFSLQSEQVALRVGLREKKQKGFSENYNMLLLGHSFNCSMYCFSILGIYAI